MAITEGQLNVVVRKYVPQDFIPLTVTKLDDVILCKKNTLFHKFYLIT